jgi:DNA helicase-2/ATP-dependent DNA helicase PcrA
MSKGIEFSKAYATLNPRQKEAVDTIEGPVMVVAGPGTGKTQLLSMRVANILRRTDVLPSNILCLTFTESAATAMRQRLVSLMGQQAYKVAIHTFHSFGGEVINHNPQYFYQGAHFRPADELSSYEVLEPIFEKLPHKDPLATTMNGEFTALRDVQFGIANLKKASLLPDELLKILNHNETFLNFAEPTLAKVFDVPRFSKKHLPDCQRALTELEAFQPEPMPIKLFKPLAEVCTHELTRALEAAAEASSTQPMTAWRNRWLEKNGRGVFVFKDRARTRRLRALSEVYQKYLEGMQERELYDFDDMILRVVHGLEVFPDLRYNLQEQYQYILVDEFQDTNGAQLRLLQGLTNARVNEGRPNILVVGDDDQAIYSFQGAEIGNILQFRDLYRDPVTVTLVDNYRSTDAILGSARAVITQGSERLEVVLDGIDKTLIAHHRPASTTSQLHQFANPTEQYRWIATRAKQLIAEGIPPHEIAILGRNHRQLIQVLPHLRQAGLSLNYERRNNVLETEHIVALTLMARVIVALEQQRFDIAEALLPQLLSYEFWGLKTEELWQLSLSAYRQHKFWLELMLERDGKLKRIAEFLIVTSHESRHAPLETILDKLIGSSEPQVPNEPEQENENGSTTGPDEETFTSPLRDYYFNEQRLNANPSQYLTMLSNLAVIRHRLREYRPDLPLMLNDFVGFIDLHEKTHTPIVDNSDHTEGGQAIQLMTAHKSKGLEFDAVFVLSCQEEVWGNSARTRTSSVRFPHNLPIEPAGQTDDDCLRLFFVAMTRARAHLYLAGYQTDDSGRQSLPINFLQNEAFQPITHDVGDITAELLQTLEPTWQIRHIDSPHTTKRTLLQPQLDKYQLSVTHLNNFLDVTSGGPQAFLLQNLLRFPQAMGIGAVFGSAVHAVLQRAHVHLNSSGEKRPVEDILHDFEIQLQNSRLSERDFNYLLEKGSDVLPLYLTEHYHLFAPDQLAEYSFTNQGVVVGEARLTGAIDLLDVRKDTHKITVTDYKTGKPSDNWRGATEYEKIKLHKYRQQLMMYKLLVEGSRDFGGQYRVNRGIIEFVESDGEGAVHSLGMDFDPDELERFKALIQIVWQHIMRLDMPDTGAYPPTYKGIRAFEDDLLQKL